MVRHKIVGSGMIASALYDIRGVQNITFYAAGVSNSRCTDKDEFARDEKRLREELKTAPMVVYFGSCEQKVSSPYFAHKTAMEDIVRDHPGGHLICRLPIVAGASPNPHTLLNYLYARIARSEALDIWKGARRRVIDVKDVATIVEWLIREGAINETVNIAPPTSWSIDDIVHVFEEITCKYAITNTHDAGSEYDDRIDTRRISGANVDFSGDYLGRTLRRYWA